MNDAWYFAIMTAKGVFIGGVGIDVVRWIARRKPHTPAQGEKE